MNHFFRLHALLACFFLYADATAQNYILGRILDDEEVPYAHATAQLRGDDYFSEQICSELGVFRFEKLKSGSYELILITPYGIRRRPIELRTSIDITLHIARKIPLDEISVVASQAGENEPVTHDNLNRSDIVRSDFGQDMPYLLQQSPSVVVTSDAGHGIGYTGVRIRGTDPTRINVTLNGVPVNDAESHQVFWVDLPDLASSSNSVQIQRGVGWSQPGTGDFGGSVQVNTMNFQAKHYAEIKSGYGTFNTLRNTLSLGSGLFQGRYTMDVRGSYIQSDGYIDRASSQLYSFYSALGYHHDATHLTLIATHGDELTYQAWNGVPAQYINDPIYRNFNTAGTEKDGDPHDNEVDDYGQTHFQLHLDQAVTPFARWKSAVHLTKGKGFFEQYKADQNLAEYGIHLSQDPTDLIRRRWLDNDFYGFISTLHIGKPEGRYFILGGGWNRYNGNHFGEVIWLEDIALSGKPKYYINDAVKRDGNIFGRSNMKVTQRFDITIDLQQRWIRYMFEGKDQGGNITDQEVQHSFFNPKIGLQYEMSDAVFLYGLTGLQHKEPNRDDYVESTPLSRPNAERLHDNELGVRIRHTSWSIETVLYAMLYKDQLVPTGRLNDVGAYTRVNVPTSHRLGIEIQSSVQVMPNLLLHAGATISRNRIKEYVEYIDDWDTGLQTLLFHQNTSLAFSPELLFTGGVNWDFLKKEKQTASVNFVLRHVGEQYVDNSGNPGSLLEAYTTGDLSLRYTFLPKWAKECNVALRVNNVFDALYEANGWIYRFRSATYDPRPDDPYAEREGQNLYHLKGYFPQAGRHLMAQVSVRF